MNFAQVKGITIPQGAVKQLSQGQTTLWKKRGGVLPADYLELIGIAYDGDFHYETGEKLYGSDVITITLDSTSTTGQNVFGSYNGTASGRKNFSLFIYGNGSSSNSYLRYGETLYRPKYGTGKRTLVFGGNGTTDGFATDVAITPDTFVTDVQAFIGWLPNSTSPHYTGDIVGRITAGNRLIWIPVERISDGEIGYYELNSGVFLTKTGTGTPVSLGYKDAPFDSRVAYLETQAPGTQYIDCGFKATEQIGLEIGLERVNNNIQVDFGAEDGWSSKIARFVVVAGSNNMAHWRYGNTASGIVNTPNGNVIGDIKVVAQRNAATIYNLSTQQTYNVESAVSGAFKTTGNFLLLACNVGSTPDTSSSLVGQRLKYAKVTDNGISLDLIPVRVGMVGYMYDINSGRLFPNAGTGDFVLGSDI